MTRLRDPYAMACAAVIILWFAAWLSVFHNIYGWLTDDAMTFGWIVGYERGGKNLLDIVWFHAYMWLLMTWPWLFHWSLPSYDIPRAWERTGEFRALILYVISLHVVLVGVVAYFLRRLCSHNAVCFGAFLLWITSPTLVYYADLLDSRYLGLIIALPALVMLMANAEKMYQASALAQRLRYAFFPGFILAVAQAIHYTALYLCVPFCLVYWVLVFSRDWRSKNAWYNLALFALGGLVWLVPVELISLKFHPFGTSMLGMMINQVHDNAAWPGQPSNLSQWTFEFVHEMGIPLMLASISGALLLSSDRLRPSYVGRLEARVMVGSAVIMAILLLVGRTYPLYRQLSGLQIFYVLFAMVALERAVAYLARFGKRFAAAAAIVLFGALAYLPSGIRTPEVFVAQQGLGRAVNYAHEHAGGNHIFFMPTYDWDPNPKAVLSRADFDRLGPSDYLITDYPIFNHIKYPDIFALLHDAKPVQSFPTLWCTQESWVELGPYFDYRPWYREPMNCDAQVYRVSDIRAAESGKQLGITSVTADSSARPDQSPARVFAQRNPSYAVNDDYLTGLHDLFEDLWASQDSPLPHWLQVTFEKPARIGAVTIVPPDWEYVGRIRAMKIYGGANVGVPTLLLWSSDGLMGDAVFTARFSPTLVRSLRFVIEDQGRFESNRTAAIVSMRFPGFRLNASHVENDGAFRPFEGTSQSASHIAVSSSGAFWLLGQNVVGAGGYDIYRYSDFRLTQVPGEASSLSVDGHGVGWVVSGLDGSLYRFDRSNDSFTSIRTPFRVTQIAIGTDGSKWILTRNTGRGTGGGNIYEYDRSAWRRVPGVARYVAVGPSGDAWIITKNGEIAHFDRQAWRFRTISVHARASRIAIGPDEAVWILADTTQSGDGHAIYEYRRDTLSRVPGLATDIALDAHGIPWILGPDGRIYRLDGRLSMK